MRPEIRFLVALAAVASLSVGVGSAVGHNTSYSSKIEITSLDGPNNQLDVGGMVESPKARCLPRRTVKLYAIDSGGDQQFVVLTKTRQSPAGFWGAQGNFAGADKVKAKVVRKNIGPAGHHHICEPDSDQAPLGP